MDRILIVDDDRSIRELLSMHLEERGFGVVSFGKQNLAWVLAYVANQKQHHAAGTAVERLECADRDDEPEPDA